MSATIKVRILGVTVAAVVALVVPTMAQAQNCELPGVLVVLDRSASMAGQINGQRKWDIAVAGLQSLLEDHDNQAAFGMMLYPGPSGSGANGVEGPVGACRYEQRNDQCSPQRPRCTTGEVVVDIGPNNGDAILGQLAWPEGLSHSYTPTWQSLEAAHRYGPLHDPVRRNFVILITDGWQCCGFYNPSACEFEARSLQVDKVEQLAESGIATYVIGFGGSVDVATLQRMAVAGGTARPGCNPDAGNVAGDDHCYYQADDHNELEAMLDGIGREIAEELCDGRDNDCNGRVDEDLNRPCFTACGEGTSTCRNGDWGDCSVNDPEIEICDDLDNNCDGRVDEGLSQPCSTRCGVGVERCERGDWAGCDAPAEQPEICDGIDNDCDGVVDPGCECTPGEVRPCGENVGECSAGEQRCNAAAEWEVDCEGGVGPRAEVCDGRDNDCDGAPDGGLVRACQTSCGGGEERCDDGRWLGCDAPEPTDELCDGIDNDCDGVIDQGITRPCSTVCGIGIESCEAGQWGDCTARKPSAVEVCNNGLDDNCNGQVEEGCVCQDGQTQPCGAASGECAAGEQVCVAGQWGECNGGTLPITESCNGIDDDCNGIVDDPGGAPGGRLCPPGETCGCGACVGPCAFGECFEGALCIGGFCIADACPEGRVCRDGVCVEGQKPPGENNGGGPGLGGDSGGLGNDGLGGEADDDKTGTPANACDCAVGQGPGFEDALMSRLGSVLRR